MTPEEESKTDNTWLRGHSDGSAVTFITSQPMASLQCMYVPLHASHTVYPKTITVRDYHDGQWKFVGHIPDALIVNAGDMLEFLTGSYVCSVPSVDWQMVLIDVFFEFKSTIHRVVRPPSDQLGHRRLGLSAFCIYLVFKILNML